MNQDSNWFDCAKALNRMADKLDKKYGRQEMTEEKAKGIERDISVIALDNDRKPIVEYTEFRQVETVQGIKNMPIMASRRELTLSDLLVKFLDAHMEGDTTELKDFRQRNHLSLKLQKYGNRPISLKMDNWTFLRNRLMKAKIYPVAVSQLDAIIDGELTEAAMEDL